MSPATNLIWHAMRRSVREGWPGLRVPPILLDGPPGIGKSHLARLLGEAISAPTTVIEATGDNTSFGVVGSQRGWGGSCPGRVLETIIQSRIANCVIVVDEIEKAGVPTSMKVLTLGLSLLWQKCIFRILKSHLRCFMECQLVEAGDGG